MINDIPSKLLAFLLSHKYTSEPRFKKINTKYKGSWIGNAIEIMGDVYDTDLQLHAIVNCKDITKQVLKEYRKYNLEHEPDQLSRIDTIMKECHI